MTGNDAFRILFLLAAYVAFMQFIRRRTGSIDWLDCLAGLPCVIFIHLPKPYFFLAFMQPIAGIMWAVRSRRQMKKMEDELDEILFKKFGQDFETYKKRKQ